MRLQLESKLSAAGPGRKVAWSGTRRGSSSYGDKWTGHIWMPYLGSSVDYLAQDFVSDETPVNIYFRHLPSLPLQRVKAALLFQMGAIEMIYILDTAVM